MASKDTTPDDGDGPGSDAPGEPAGSRGDSAGAAPDADESAADRPVPSGPPNRTALMAVVIPLIIMVITSNIAAYFGAGMITERPALVIALGSQIRWLVLAVNHLDPAVFFTIGMLRNLAPDPLFYLLGYWYGDSAVRWMERRIPSMGEVLRQAETHFPRWGRPIVVIWPNNPVCLLAGVARMPVAEFAIFNVVGTAGRLILIKIFGRAFETPINWFLHLLQEYRIPLLVIGGLAFAFTMWNENRKGTSEVRALVDLEEEFDPRNPTDMHDHADPDNPSAGDHD
jgi:membrane protein DedA with SNARE-associated domain